MSRMSSFLIRRAPRALSALAPFAILLVAGCAETASQPNAAPAPAPAEIAAAYAEPAVQATAPDDPAMEAYQRDQLVSALGSLASVERAAWSSDTTLVVAVADVGTARPVLCPIVERYPALRASRLQLQPPADSGQPVRFMQCRVY